MLKDHPNFSAAASKLFIGHQHSVAAVDDNLARTWLFKGCKAAYERGFSGSASTYNAKDIAFFYIERDVMERIDSFCI